MSLSYFHSYSSNLNCYPCNYSIDKIVLTGKFVFQKSGDFLAWLSKYELLDSGDYPFGYHFYCLGYYTSTKIGSYYNSFNIELYKDNVCKSVSSFYLGVCLNSNGKKLEQWKIEFNPNKILPCQFFELLLQNLLSCSISESVVVKSWDLAVDIFASRSSFSILKDRRKYQLVYNGGEDKTEYLGTRHNHGFVKLYNKQIESDLDYSCTRFEITFNTLSCVNCMSVVPKLYFLGDKQVSFDYLSNLSKNQRVFFELLLLFPDKINELDSRGKQKYSNLLADSTVVFNFDDVALNYLCERVYNYTLGVISV